MKYVPTNQVSVNAKLHEENEASLQGRLLRVAQVAFFLIGVLTCILFVVSLPAFYTQTQSICTGDACGGVTVSPEQAYALAAHGISLTSYAWFSVLVTILFALFCFSAGWLIFWHKSDSWMALLIALLLVTAGALRSTVALKSFPDLQYWAIWITFMYDVLLFLVGALFPSGRFVPKWIRWLVPVWVVYYLVGNGYLPLFTQQVSWFPTTLIFSLVFIGILVVAQIYRYRTVSTQVQRQQTKWVVFAFAIITVAYVVLTVPFLFNPTPYLPNSPYALIAFNIFHFFELLGPISIYIAIVRYRLYDIDIIIRRTLVYGMLTACVVALYVLVVVGLGALLQSRGTLLISLLATCLVAVLFQPLRERLQRAVNRLMYGERDEPDKVISRLGQRLEATMAPDAVLPTIVETVAQALKLPYAAVTLKQEGGMVTAAAYGVPKEHLIHLPLVYHNEQLGEIVLAPRGPGESFTPADLALLEDLARQTGDAVHTVRLTTDLQYLTEELQASRTQLVTTREEERRRLRRDLHDGLGSALTSMSFQLDAASNILERDPQAARTLLADLKRQTQAAIADIRRLVYNLRPPILDEWGLVAALREQVAQYQLDHVRVCVEAPESLPPLPAAVEVAAYRIALEALANVVRHAHASNCIMRLALSDEVLTIEVRDDGEGLPKGYHAGVGISAMRERAAELGGSCSVETITGGGVRISAWLPLQKEGGSVDVG